MEKYQFIGEWVHVSSPPSSGVRCLVCDGELVTIATYAVDDKNGGIWIFSELEKGMRFDIQGWMDLPKSMKKIVSFSDKTASQS